MFSLLQHDRIDKMFNRFFPLPGCYLDVGVVKKKNVVFGVACVDKPSRIRGFFLGLPLIFSRTSSSIYFVSASTADVERFLLFVSTKTENIFFTSRPRTLHQS